MTRVDLLRGTAPAGPKVLPSTGTLVEDDGLYDLEFVCAFFGGNKPLHPATVYRGIAAGRYPRPLRPSPNVNRWLGKELKAAKQAIMDAPRAPLTSPRGRQERFHVEHPRAPLTERSR